MTAEPYSKIRRSFTNISRFHIVDIDDFIENTTFDLTDPGHLYIMNDEVERMLRTGIKSRKQNPILYINSRICPETIIGIKEFVRQIDEYLIDGFILLEDFDVPKMQNMYGMFDEIYFFQSLKRTRIIECKPIQHPK